MTIRELVYNFRNQLKIARPDDLTISDRQIEFMINYIREQLIVQQSQKGRTLSGNVKQDLGQVELISVDQASEGSLESGKSIFRTKNRIPQPIELDQMDAITYVGGIDRLSPIPFKNNRAAMWNKYSKYASKEPIAYYRDGYIFISDCPNPLLKFINIEGVFLNPRDVFKFKHVDGTPCYNPDVDSYPISGRMIKMLNGMTKEELNIFLQVREDTSNNATTTT